MSTLRQQLSDLAALLQVHLLQEHSIQDWKIADSDSYQYFKNFVQSKQARKSAPPPTSAPIAAPQAPQQQTVRPIPTKPASTPIIQPKQVETPKKDTIVEPSQQAAREHAPPIEKHIVPASFELHLPSAPQIDQFSDIKRILEERIQALPLLSEVPDDSLAKKIRRNWLNKDFLCPVVFLSFTEGEGEIAFLEQVVQAVRRFLAPASIINASNLNNERLLQLVLNSNQVRFIVSSLRNLQASPFLTSHYQAVNHKLGPKQVLLIEDLSVYMQDQDKKATLWRSLQALFK